jgi:hypothetical protein
LIGEAGSFANGAAGGYGSTAANDLQVGGLYANEAGNDMGAAGGALGTVLNHFYPGGNYGISPTPDLTPPNVDAPLPQVSQTPVNIPPPIQPVSTGG